IFVSFSLPLALLGLILGVDSISMVTWPLFQLTIVARLAAHFIHRGRGGRSLFADLWLLPARDLLMCWVWCRTFFTSRFTWRGSDFGVGADGIMRKLT